jgi:hypothetical protein
MQTARTATLASICLAIGILLGTGLLSAPQAISYAEPVAGPAPAQYTTVTVDTNSLEAKLGDLARDNWEVFSITTASSTIDQGGDGKTHIVIEKFQVTAHVPRPRFLPRNGDGGGREVEDDETHAKALRRRGSAPKSVTWRDSLYP